MKSILAFFASLRLYFSPATTDLKESASSALATVAAAKDDIKAAEAALVALKLEKVTESQEALDALRAEAEAAAAAEIENEKARLKTLDGFDKVTTDQVTALENRLAALKRRRELERTCLSDELTLERDEAAADARVATDAAVEIAAEIEELAEGAAAQSGLNGSVSEE